ncbi:MAG TPA: polyphosphate kinase 1 [Candidatus Methanoperedens sp.]|nr:polyphosphate kinase 1 [Candidatus Methanoperedens sp.]
MTERSARKKAGGKSSRAATPASRKRAAKATGAAFPISARTDLLDPALYLNRELTWLAFASRVLHEAEDERTPLLERVKFLAITAANLDEFFMKRIGGLKQQVEAGVQKITVDGRTPAQQIKDSLAVVAGLRRRMDELAPRLVKLLRAEGIDLARYEQLTKEEQAAVRVEYVRAIYPLATPQSVDPAHPFPFVSNLSLNLLVTLRYPGESELSLARVKVPVGLGARRFLRAGARERFVRIEEVLSHNLDLLFPGMEIMRCELFRVTRNANAEKDEESADDLLALIESELQERRFAPIVRLEVDPGMEPSHRGRLAAELDLDETQDVAEVGGIFALRDLSEIAAVARPDLKDPAHHPIDHPLLQTERSIFHVIRDAGSLLLQHPYEAFASSLERFLKEAAEDPKVRAIKMTLYRTASESNIVEHLVAAARNGKQVAVVVELKARFDEEANIRLASRMEEAGIHVTYGVVGLKTHAKVTLVVRQDYNGLQRYVHVGTGNYHPVTSRLYADLGLLTADETIGADATELFNYLTTGFTPKRAYRKLLVAPKSLKAALLEKIRREIRSHGRKGGGLIRFKMNALEDADVARALYAASRAGVAVELLVRDSCRVRPGVPGVSETIRVVSIVGRFLEHARVYYFRNGGEEEYYIGSADAMKRNLEYRVEVLAPVEAPALQAELKALLDIQWRDRRSAWEMRADGSYVQRQPAGRRGEEEPGSQETLIRLAEKRFKTATRLRKRTALTPGKRNLR